VFDHVAFGQMLERLFACRRLCLTFADDWVDAIRNVFSHRISTLAGVT
jgi:hypothetical protein